MNAVNTIGFKVSPDEEAFLLRMKEEVDRGIKYMREGLPDRALLIFKQFVPKVDPSSPAYDLLQHNLLTAYMQRIEQLLATDDVTPVNRYLPEVFALELRGSLTMDFEFRRRFADTYKRLGMVFYENRQHEAALASFKRAIAIEQDPSYYVNLTNALAFTRKRAELRDYTTAYGPNELGRHIFITCAPKSGSTFLKNVLVGVTGFRDVFSMYAAMQNEQELDRPQLVRFGKENTVTQQHVRASEANIHLMQAFAIRPVILVRNIFDTVMSLLDFYRKGFTTSTFFDRNEFHSFDEEQQIDLLIAYAIPWYFQFVASWQRAEREGRIAGLWMTYEEMVVDKPGSLQRILKFHGITAPLSAVDSQILRVESEGEKNRFNKGVRGRGRAGLTDSQRNRVASLGRHFPSADFGVLGL
ncbi:MAG: sulfotransferase domain-containing protein [Pyrinomonadaceae bacterium]